MSLALQAAILIQLDANADAMVTVKTLALRLAMDAGLVSDELEVLWALGQVKAFRDPLGESIIGAQALPAAEPACA